jgi:hypothetical protein
MNVQAPFGFVTACHAGDKFMVQATLASMRHYCPTVPICLIADGVFDVSDLEEEYDLIVLRVPDLPLAEMRSMIGGNFRAKLAAMWEGPFEFYVWMDSDAIVWGDFTVQVRRDLDFQIFWDEPKPDVNSTVPPWMLHYYFDPDLLKQFDAKFEWRGNSYFCSGAFACHRNAISFAEWAQVEAWGKQMDGLFGWGEMGMLNYLVYAKAQRGEIKIATADLQDLWSNHGTQEFEQDCAGVGWKFPEIIRRPRVAHFCGRKPFLFDRHAYSRPFTIARLEHHRRQHGNLGAWFAVLNEERTIVFEKIRRRAKRLFSA